MTGRIRITPESADLFVGRDKLVSDLIHAALTERAVLLFGGRQSGKTTLLRQIERTLNTMLPDVTELKDVVVGVYVNLMALPYDAGPSEVFRRLIHRAATTCSASIAGYVPPTCSSLSAPSVTLDMFCEDLEILRGAAQELDLRVVFMLDESKRILGDRFPRGFQDNLFALLYGGDTSLADNVSIVFAGARELYRFCEEDTSPIGSRASMIKITNLAEADIKLLLARVFPELGRGSDVVAAFLYEETGGQAGLTARFIERIAELSAHSVEGIEEIGKELRTRYQELFRIWTISLTDEAKIVQNKLADHGRLTLKEIARCLAESGHDRYLARLVMDLLQFTGVAKVSGEALEKVNRMYWDFVSEFGYEDSGSQGERDVWALIEEVEVTLRSVIRAKYEAAWSGKAVERMRGVLGEESWGKIEAVRMQSGRYYRYSPGRPERDVMECMYLGQLVDLMLTNLAWSHFKGLFRDKRELQDMLSAIGPARNDRAHFATVPPKELERCRIACDDLLVIIQMEEERASGLQHKATP